MSRTRRKNVNQVKVATNTYRAAGYIRLSVVKDLSRLGRDAIEVGFYLQHLFPQKGVRFVSVSDKFDTLDGITDISTGVALTAIFATAEQGLSLNEIVHRLNPAHIPTPIDYAITNGLQGNFEQGDGLWNSRSVKYILMNRTYTGDP